VVTYHFEGHPIYVGTEFGNAEDSRIAFQLGYAVIPLFFVQFGWHIGNWMFSALVIGLEQLYPTAVVDASHWMVNAFLKSGMASTGAVAMLVFKSSNALIAYSDNSNFFMRSFFNEDVPLSGRSFG